MRRIVLPLLALTMACNPGPEPAHLLWSKDAQSLDNPFPDLRLLDENGLQVRADWYVPFMPGKAVNGKMRTLLSTYAQSASHEIFGLGNFGAVALRSSAPLDRSSLSQVAARLHRTALGWEVLEADVAVEHAQSALDGTGVAANADYPEFIFARPSVALPDGEEGLLVLKKGLRTVDGSELGRGREADQDADSRQRLRDAAAALGVDEKELLLAVPQRAYDAKAPLAKLAAWTVSRQVPSYTVPPKAIVTDAAGLRWPVGTWKPSEADWTVISHWLEYRDWSRPASAVGQVQIGTFQSRDLRQNGVWNKAWLENPDLAPAADLTFVLVVPAGAKPAGGWPLIIGGHGLNNRNTPLLGDDNAFCLQLGQVLAQKGLACIGIDAPSHGQRGNPLDFFAVEDIVVARENMRQMAFDLMQLSRTGLSIDVDGDGAADFSEVGYWGNSLGGIMGANFMQLDPRVKYGVLNVPGGGLTNIIAGPGLRDRLGLLLVAKTGITFESPEYYGLFPFMRVMGQAFVDPGDPVVLANHFRADVPVFVQESIGDGTMPNTATVDLARSMGLPEVTPPVSGSLVQAFFQADAANFMTPEQAAEFDRHGLMWGVDAYRDQAIGFLKSRGTVLPAP